MGTPEKRCCVLNGALRLINSVRVSTMASLEPVWLVRKNHFDGDITDMSTLRLVSIEHHFMF